MGEINEPKAPFRQHIFNAVATDSLKMLRVCSLMLKQIVFVEVLCIVKRARVVQSAYPAAK
jgi:hypothetical protein